MPESKTPVTAAVRLLRHHRIAFTEHLYEYEDRGGARQGASALGLDGHLVIKTLIMQDERKQPLIVLIHGDRQVSTKALARQLGVKSITPCDPETANKHSGYVVGGTSPFATRRKMPVYAESSILELPRLFINGGKRGYLIGMSSTDLKRILDPSAVQVAIDD